METYDYDLAVIGSGPAGQKGAIAGAKLGKRVAIIDRQEMTGGVCLQTGTIPSKTVREAILYLRGFRQRTFYGKDYVVSESNSARDLGHRRAAEQCGDATIIIHPQCWRRVRVHAPRLDI